MCATAMMLLLGSIPLVASGKSVLAVAPCVVGPGVREDLGAAVTELVLVVVRDLPGIVVLDRSTTSQVLREQDLAIVSRATAVLPGRVGDLGAQQVLVTGLLELPSGFLLSMRVIDVGSGEVVRSSVHRAPSEKNLLSACGDWARQLWENPSKASGPPQASDRVESAVEDVWTRLDNAETRRLLGPDLERAESVYQQYCQAAETAAAEEASRLAAVAGVYLTDCLSLLQRALSPPAGMVYVPPGWVTLSVAGKRPRRFWLTGFFVDRMEYTAGQYVRFLQETQREAPPGWSAPTGQASDLPVVGVDWHDADAAAKWRGMLLPTYPQWLRAVGGEEPARYPWGESWEGNRCLFAKDPRHPRMEPVGSHPGGASCFGVLDGVGSVFEWLDTWDDREYWDGAPSHNPPGPRQGSAKLAAGGSYRCGPEGCTCSTVQVVTPRTRRDDLGFRCVLPIKGDLGPLVSAQDREISVSWKCFDQEAEP